MITEPPPADYGKTCTLIGYNTQISISIQSQAVLPEFMSASINNSIVIDECVSGSSSRYVFRRHNDHNATLTLLAVPGSPIEQMFLEADGTPKGEVELSAQITGRDECDADDIEVTNVQKPLKWVPVYPNGEGCGLGGYSGF